MARLPRSRRDVSEEEALRRTLLLTAREGQVFAALDRPLSQPEMAAELGMSLKTIETHITHIGRKLGWAGRANLSYLAMRAKVGQLPPGSGDDQLLSELRRQIERHDASHQALLRILELTAPCAGGQFLAGLADALGQSLGVRVAAVVAADDVDSSIFRILSLHHRGRVVPPTSFPRAGSALAGPRELLLEEDVRGALPADPIVGLIRARSCLALRMDDETGTALGGLVLVHDDRIDPQRAPELILRLMAGRTSAELAHARSERRLRSSEERARLIVEHSGDVISRHTVGGVYTYVSPAVQAVLGWRPLELLGRSAYEFVHPEDVPRLGAALGALLRDHGPHRVRHRVRRRHGGWAEGGPDDGPPRAGGWVWLDSVIRGVPSTDTGVLEEILMVSRDASQESALLEERQAALRRSEARYRSLIEHLPAGVLVHDFANVSFANTVAASLLGWPTAASMVGTPIFDIIDPAFRERVEDRHRALREEGGTAPLMRQLLRGRDGRSVELDVLGVACTFDDRPAVQVIMHPVVTAPTAPMDTGASL